MHNLTHEEGLAAEGYQLIAGLDEAGRGALAGPVVAASVIIFPQAWHEGVTDSKLLSASVRDALYRWILAHAVSIGVGQVGPTQIDQINILKATFQAMHEAVQQMSVQPDFLLVDGRDFPFPGRVGAPLVKGDRASFSIACASIVAKVTRDRIMEKLHHDYPAYRFDQHKGYGTRKHYQAIDAEGILDIHRRTFLKSIYPQKKDLPEIWEV